jgi:hypothetical protein
MDCSLRYFRDDGGDIAREDDVRPHVQIRGCIVDDDQMRTPVQGLHRQPRDREDLQRGPGNQHQVAAADRALRFKPGGLRKLFPKQYHIWFQDSIAI